MKVLSLNKITKIYDKRSIFGIKNVSFDVSAGEIVSLTGPSGSGKTTALNIITGLCEKDSGTLSVTPKLSYIPQLAAIDDSKTVMENILSGVDSNIEGEKKINLARSSAQSLELTNELEKLPTQISGGQRQRVIMARALVSEPELIIMDEPFAHLDTQLRYALIHELWNVFRDKKIAIVWVTHETNEALAFSDKVIVINQGLIQQIGSSREIYEKPSNMFVANFFGNANCIAGKVTQSSPVEIEFLGSKIQYQNPNFKINEHKDALVIIRPESIELLDSAALSGKVERTFYMGDHQLVEFSHKDKTLIAKSKNTIKFQNGQKIKFDFIKDEIYCLGEI